MCFAVSFCIVLCRAPLSGTKCCASIMPSKQCHRIGRSLARSLAIRPFLVLSTISYLRARHTESNVDSTCKYENISIYLNLLESSGPNILYVSYAISAASNESMLLTKYCRRFSEEHFTVDRQLSLLP